MIVFILHTFRLKVLLLLNSFVSFLSMAREARVDLRSRAREAKPRSGKRESRTGEGGNKAILLNFYSTCILTNFALNTHQNGQKRRLKFPVGGPSMGRSRGGGAVWVG